MTEPEEMTVEEAIQLVTEWGVLSRREGYCTFCDQEKEVLAPTIGPVQPSRCAECWSNALFHRYLTEGEEI